MTDAREALAVAEAIAAELEAHANIASRPGQRKALFELAERVRRLALVVPDSAGLADRVRQAVDDVAVDHPAWETAATDTRPFTSEGEANYAQFVDDITRAVLAAVGQGVTAAQAWDEGYAAGLRDGAEDEQRIQMRDWWGGTPTTPNPYRALLAGSGEQPDDEGVTVEWGVGYGNRHTAALSREYAEEWIADDDAWNPGEERWLIMRQVGPWTRAARIARGEGS